MIYDYYHAWQIQYRSLERYRGLVVALGNTQCLFPRDETGTNFRQPNLETAPEASLTLIHNSKE